MESNEQAVTSAETFDAMLTRQMDALDLAATSSTIPDTVLHSESGNPAELPYIDNHMDEKSLPRGESTEDNGTFPLSVPPASRKYAVVPYYNPEPPQASLAGLPAEIKKKIYDLCLDPRMISARLVTVKAADLSNTSAKLSNAGIELDNSMKFDFVGARRPTLAKVSKYEEFFLKEMMYKPCLAVNGSDKIHYFHPEFDRLDVDLSLACYQNKNPPDLSINLKSKADLGFVRYITMEAEHLFLYPDWVVESVEQFSSLNAIELRSLEHDPEYPYSMSTTFRFVYDNSTPDSVGFFPDILMPAPFGFQTLMTVRNEDDNFMVDDPAVCEIDEDLINRMFAVLSKICRLSHFPKTVFLESCINCHH